MDRTQLKDSVNLAGSVASITGISLLWLKNLAPQSSLAFAVPIYLVASVLGVGVVALAFLVFNFGYNLFLGGFAIPREKPSTAGKLAYTGLAGGLSLILTGLVLCGIFFLAWDFVRGAPQIFRVQ